MIFTCDDRAGEDRLDPLLFALVVASFAVAGLTLLAVLSRIESAAEQVQRNVGRLSADLERALSAIRSVKVNHAEAAEIERLTASAHQAYTAGVRTSKLTALVNPAIHLAVTGSFMFALLFGGIRVASGSSSLSELVTMLLYVMYLVIPVGDLFDAGADLRKAMGSMNRIQETLNLSVEEGLDVRTPRETPRVQGAAGEPAPPEYVAGNELSAGPAGNGSAPPALEFRGVHFSYGDHPVLKQISFTVPDRSHLALVGRSGAGKSTVFSLICRFYQPSQGEILVGGTPMSAVPPPSDVSPTMSPPWTTTGQRPGNRVVLAQCKTWF
ncbi:ABC transporter transmembrane domain-containing protein [Streptomyces sp. NBC_01511]|uniref:ABC transporter transmembrane domain-containing protein n=1 Tax=Streptomyces sp. NBC_01511 TaxID=2903889 RepID=UPI00386E58AB